MIVVCLIGVVLGFLVVMQLRSQATVAATLAAQDDTSIALLINDLNKANNQLLQQSTDLSQQEAQLHQSLSSGGADAQGIQKTLTTLNLVDGVVPVHGPGLTIRIQGSVMDFELQDLLNSLRQAGGEAFSVNGYRVISSTPIISKGNDLMVDGRSIGSTLVLNVIGDPDQLGPAADLAVTSLQTRIQIDIQRKADLAITEVVTARPLIYAQLGR
ncbi:MAG TPA: DUF881 domain-containing protein [Candidatus Dormibacteraeota bacterium]|nr:DUF881 domain-containing protein [Candidatus Dormibacteraeota bacterium]